MLIIPVHATVIIFEFSISPELTITGGRGAISAPPRHFIFAIIISIPPPAAAQIVIDEFCPLSKFVRVTAQAV